MARRVLNKAAVSGDPSPILNYGMSRIDRFQPGSGNNRWWTSDGLRCYVNRESTSSKCIVNGAWLGSGSHSYHSGMGVRMYNSGNNSIHTEYGWGYIWQNNSGTDMSNSAHLFRPMQIFDASGEMNNETGQISFRIGHNSKSGGNQQPANTWAGDYNNDARQRGDHYGYWQVMEIDSSKIAHANDSHTGGY